MARRIFLHIAFWSAFVLLHASVQMAFAGPSDMVYAWPMRLLRFVGSELALLPWKMLPFYVLFYLLVPRYLGGLSAERQDAKFGPLVAWMLVCILVSVLGYRSMIKPISLWMYDEVPAFNVFSTSRLLYTLTDILPALALASTAKLLIGRLKSQRAYRSLQAEKRDIELGYLKSQMNPHFLFNSLNNLYGLARKDAAQTAPYILQLSHLMRYVLRESQEERILLEQEIEIIEDYIALEKLRYADRLQLRQEIQVTTSDIRIPPLILLPFVENAFKHGLSEMRFETQIELCLEANQHQLQFEVRNSYDTDSGGMESGMGLQNVRRQLDLVCGDHYDLTIRKDASFFYVRLQIQLDGINQ